MKNLDKYHYICSTCGREWVSNKEMKSLKIKNKKIKRDPVNFELKENVIKKKNGTIKTVELEIIEIKNNREELEKKYSHYNIKINKCPKCIVNKKEADSFLKKNKLQEIGMENETKKSI